jgi:putrescine transport system permease protein
MHRSRFLGVCLLGGYAFLYAPIVLLVLTSFNDSRLTTVWTGFSLRWFAALAQDDALVDAALLSLRIAALAATIATVVGGLAGVALARLGRFRGRALFAGLLAAPLVLPDLLIGLALLLLFVAVQQATGFPERGAGTIVAAHVTASLAYVAVVVEARLAGGGEVLEQAAMDLGATPELNALATVILAITALGLAAVWGVQRRRAPASR